MSVFDEPFICCDHTLASRGRHRELVGTAIVFQHYNNFRKDYFNVIEQAQNIFDVNYNKNVIKARDIISKSPSYIISDVIEYIVEELIQHDSISFISLTNTHTNQSFSFSWENGETSSINFIEKILHQYYPIVPVWRYYGLEEIEDPVKNVILDGISGKITKAWKIIGKTADNIYIVPHGDSTHPALSFCDILSQYIKTTVVDINEKEIEKLLNNYLPEDKFYNGFISDPLLDYIKPQFPYTINPSVHYLHPLFLICSKEINKNDVHKQVFRESEFFDKAHQLAEQHKGSSFGIDPKTHIQFLEDGDKIICADDDSFREITELISMFPSRDIEIIKRNEFFEYAIQKINGY